MANINFNASQYTPATGEQDIIPAGWVIAAITKSEMKPATTAGNFYLSLEFTVVDGVFAKRKFWEILNIVNASPVATRIANEQLSAICHSVGVLQVADSSQLHNIPLNTKLKIQPAEGQYAAKNQVVAYKHVTDVVEYVGLGGAAVQQQAPGATPGTPAPGGTPPAPGSTPPAHDPAVAAQVAAQQAAQQAAFAAQQAAQQAATTTTTTTATAVDPAQAAQQAAFAAQQQEQQVAAAQAAQQAAQQAAAQAGAAEQPWDNPVAVDPAAQAAAEAQIAAQIAAQTAAQTAAAGTVTPEGPVDASGQPAWAQ